MPLVSNGSSLVPAVNQAAATPGAGVARTAAIAGGASGLRPATVRPRETPGARRPLKPRASRVGVSQKDQEAIEAGNERMAQLLASLEGATLSEQEQAQLDALRRENEKLRRDAEARAARLEAVAQAAVASSAQAPVPASDSLSRVELAKARAKAFGTEPNVQARPRDTPPPRPQQQQEQAQAAQPKQAAAVPPPQAAAPSPQPQPQPEEPTSLSEERWRQMRDAAIDEVANLDAAKAAAGKSGWRTFTVPSRPVAGADCVVFFNRVESDVLRSRPRLVLMGGFNNWEVPCATVDLLPAECPRGEGQDWWSARIAVPNDAYELKFVLNDGEGRYDNNGDADYWVPLSSIMTAERWQAEAPKREAARQAEIEERQRLAAELEEQQRQQRALQGDVDRAMARVEDLKRSKERLLEGAATSFSAGEATVWAVLPADVCPGEAMTLYYNRTAGPLADMQEPEQLRINVGHNGWADGSVEHEAARVSLREKRAIKELGEGEWWAVRVPVPKDAAVLNFVVGAYDRWDNNNGLDYKVAVKLPSWAGSFDAWVDSLSDGLIQQERATRVAAEEAAAAKKSLRDAQIAEMRAKATALRKRQLRHVLYTVPEEPVPGQPLSVYYNPGNTNLAGRHKVYLRGGFNRWRHPTLLGPVQMVPPKEGEGTHFHAKVDVPADAAIMDLVFSDVAEGEGTYDNRGGLDYHIPIANSKAKLEPLHVCHIAVEMAPICKVGGLGDVVTSLGRAVQAEGNQVEVVIPRYGFFNSSPLLGGSTLECEFEWGGTRVYVTTCVVEGLRCFFIEPKNGMFDGDFVYGGRGDDVRFDFFCKAALEFLLVSGRRPHIIHCHDWSSATVARAYWEEYQRYGLDGAAIVFSIHNLEYGQQKLGEAAFYCQRFNTVSPTYAFEVGSNPIIGPHSGKFMGIRNGIDIDIWDPETDQFLPQNYTAETSEEGKGRAREELRRRFNMTFWEDKPIVAVVTRLTKQKGIHLIKHAAFRTLERGGQFVLLGSAPDPRVQAEFDALANSMQGDTSAFCFAFDEPLSHLIYAAADIMLVPSMFEPCGLTQMVGMRYGAIPVVRSTGGLRDTVFDIDYDKPRAAWEMEGSTNWQADNVDATNGFAFEGTDEGSLDFALNRALDTFYNGKPWFRGLQKRVMQQDWSWSKPAIEYVELYHAARKAI